MKTIEKESIIFSSPQQEKLYNEIVKRIKETKNMLNKKGE